MKRYIVIILAGCVSHPLPLPRQVMHTHTAIPLATGEVVVARTWLPSDNPYQEEVANPYEVEDEPIDNPYDNVVETSPSTYKCVSGDPLCEVIQ